MTRSILEIAGQALTIEDVCAIAEDKQALHLSEDKTFVDRINKGAEFVDKLLQEEGCVYGVTTGYGDSCTVAIPMQQVEQLPKHLYTFHGCGLGQHFDPQQTRAILLVRLNSLSQGFSGVRYLLLQQISELLQHNILPLIPQEGSVGASGDLTPLSYWQPYWPGKEKYCLNKKHN